MDMPAKYATMNSGREDRRESVQHPITGAVKFQWYRGYVQRYGAVGLACDTGKVGVFFEIEPTPSVASTRKMVVTPQPAGSKVDVALQIRIVQYFRNVREKSCLAVGHGKGGICIPWR